MVSAAACFTRPRARGTSDLLILAVNSADGIDRKAFGLSSKYPAPRVTEAIQKLVENHFLHQTQDGKYYITGPGECFLAEHLAVPGKSSLPIVRRA